MRYLKTKWELDIKKKRLNVISSVQQCEAQVDYSALKSWIH